MELKNFKVQELVSPAVYDLLGDDAIRLLDSAFLTDVDKFITDVKKDLKVKSVTVNDWLWKGNYTQSGYREFKTTVGAKKSSHKSGLAVDLKFKGATNKDCYDYLLKNQHRYPRIRRIETLEATPTWLHVDGVQTNKDEIHVFNV